jgi:hypothetical protein
VKTITRLEQEIPRLSAQAVDTEDFTELKPILSELRSKIREHLRWLRAMAAVVLTTRGDAQTKTANLGDGYGNA